VAHAPVDGSGRAARYEAQIASKREKRAAARGGEPPGPKRVTKAGQFEDDSRPDRLLLALEYKCSCPDEGCGAALRSETILQLREEKRYRRGFGTWLVEALKDSVDEDEEGKLSLGFVKLCAGVHVCADRFRVVLAVRVKMWRLACRVALRESDTLWGGLGRGGLCGEFVSGFGHKEELARAWTRKIAVEVGDFTPNKEEIHIDATLMRTLWLLFCNETGVDISYSHFCHCWKKEASCKRPHIVRAGVGVACPLSSLFAL